MAQKPWFPLLAFLIAYSSMARFDRPRPVTLQGSEPVVECPLVLKEEPGSLGCATSLRASQLRQILRAAFDYPNSHAADYLMANGGAHKSAATLPLGTRRGTSARAKNLQDLQVKLQV
jgi:hypothetical protein